MVSPSSIGDYTHVWNGTATVNNRITLSPAVYTSEQLLFSITLDEIQSKTLIVKKGSATSFSYKNVYGYAYFTSEGYAQVELGVQAAISAQIQPISI